MAPLPSDTFARRVRADRERLGLSQAEVARRMAETLGTNVDATAVTRIELQTRVVRLDDAVAMAQALDIPLASLLTDDVAHENARLIREQLDELAEARLEWERSGQVILGIIRRIQALSTESELLRQHALGTQAASGGGE
ncbi:helix-turn-helix domain-containing protein [Actinomadura geliboluensis]|uniref:helix-turn-helix domain-containing protein n=1 Tax=Actinomadura geliboluensis TaxID=882440 RepID=UPI003716A1DD